MRVLSFVFAVLVFAAPAALAQGNASPLRAFGSPTPGDRGTTRVLYFDSQKRIPLGNVAINYGRPEWKKEYENQAAFDGFTKGKVWRFGKDFWTTLDTALPLKIAGKDVAPGSYYLGLHRSDDGATWSLAFIDPVKARQAGLDAFVINQATIEFKIPITTAKAVTPNDKLSVVLVAAQDNPKNLTLTIQWGTVQLTAPIQVAVQM